MNREEVPPKSISLASILWCALSHVTGTNISKPIAG